MHEFAYGATSAFTRTGPVRNPWDADRIPGGSSGGSGAAVAARLCAGALGTDTGGSVRIPAAHCGIVGLKATYGLASIRGIVPLGVSLDHVGPMCRTVADAALMLQAMAGYDPRGIASIDAEIPDYAGALRRPTSALRLGVPRTFYEDVDPQVLAAVERALGVLGDLAAGARDVELPALPGTRTVGVEAYAYHADLLDERRGLYDASTLERIEGGAETSAADYAEARYQLTLVRKAIAAVFDDVDVLVTPTLAQLPVSIEEARASPLEVTGILIRNTAPFNAYGIPAITVPCGFSRGGLPIGLQLCGRALGEGRRARARARVRAGDGVARADAAAVTRRRGTALRSRRSGPRIPHPPTAAHCGHSPFRCRFQKSKQRTRRDLRADERAGRTRWTERRGKIDLMRKRPEARGHLDRAVDDRLGSRQCRIRLIADVVTGKLDVRAAAAGFPEADGLAAGDMPDGNRAAGGLDARAEEQAANGVGMRIGEAEARGAADTAMAARRGAEEAAAGDRR